MNQHRRSSYQTVQAVLGVLQSWGMTEVVISPGSRSTALAVTADTAPGLSVHMVLDERSAGFIALGMAKVSGAMVGVVCTSGSAAAHYFPALVEANRDRVPLVVLSADRPPGSLERDAPQTINQGNLFGNQVRAFVGLPAAHEAKVEEAARSVWEAAGKATPPNAGPIHINLPFAKPLEPSLDGEAGWGSPKATIPSSPDVACPQAVEMLQQFIGKKQRGVIVAGVRKANIGERAALSSFSAKSGWPILADPLSGLRTGKHSGVISTGEILLADSFLAERLQPEAVLWAGGTPTGVFTQRWLENLSAPMAVLDPDFRWNASDTEIVLRDPMVLLLDQVDSRADKGWMQMWQAADREAKERCRQEIELHPGTELAAAGAVLESAGLVWVGSSMPVRHIDLMMDAGSPVEVYGNRGACGIDGSVAGAAGAALVSGRRVTALLGDLTFLHDLGSLGAAVKLGVDLTVVVLDNEGGAIFDMLPIAGVPGVDFERLFTTPQGVDLTAVASALGAVACPISPSRLPKKMKEASRTGGVWVLVVKTESDQMWKGYERLLGKAVVAG